MRYLNTSLLIPAFVALAACSNNASTGTDAKLQTSQTVSREIGRAFEMKIGETISVGELRLTFRSVESDSRCPIDAVCVWAGDAEIALKIEQGAQAGVAALHTMLEPKKTEWNGYTVSLVSVAPSRSASSSIDPADYRAQLIVTR
jgi:hypothetical protein